MKTDRARTELHERLDETLGHDAADTLMGYLPPVGWADVATKQDLEALRVATKKDLELLGADLRADITALRGDIYTEITTLRGDIYAEIAKLRGEMNTGFEALEKKFHTELQSTLRLHLITTVTLVLALVGATRLI